MGSLVSKRGSVGQWGSSLYVSTPLAEQVCRSTWGVPALLAPIRFEEGGGALRVERPPGEEGKGGQQIELSGWAGARVAGEGSRVVGGVPLLWTPEVKALWAPAVPLPAGQGGAGLALHSLRISASALRLKPCPQAPTPELGRPFPLGLVVDGLRIEIGPALPEPL